MIFNIDSVMKHSYSYDDTYFSIDVIDEIFEEDFDALLDEGSKILYSVEGTLLEDEIFSEFNAFMAMTADENPKSESDNEEPPFEKITINIDYKIKTSLEEPPTDLEIIPLPGNLEYIFIEEPSFLPVIISSKLSAQNKSKLVFVLKKHKEAFAWKMTDIHGIYPSFCKHKIQPLDDKKPVIQKQRRLNSNMQEVVKKEIVKLLDNRYSRESNKAYQATCKELINKEIDGPEVLNFVIFGNIHGGRALQELDEFYRTKIVDDKLDDSDEEVDSAEARRAQEENKGSPRRRPNMSFTNWLRVMDDRLGKNIRSIR
nr:reverse transcriptase domain-containing protein [Tanacetum cinerariifolium]